MEQLTGRMLFQLHRIHFQLIRSLAEASPLHSHDFFEIFIVISGNMVHCVNGGEQLLGMNQAVLIRPGDVHSFRQVDGGDCAFLNLAFSAEMLPELSSFLGVELNEESYRESEFPPVALLPEALSARAQELYGEVCLLPPGSAAADTKGRVLLVSLLENAFLPSATESGCPRWLLSLEEELRKPEVFSEGLPALSRISGKTPEHICRSYRKYRGMTPQQAISALRLAYAANLLISTAIPILEISLSCGYSSLSHFYSRFREAYGMSPAVYREKFST